MSSYYIPLPAAEYPRNALLDFTPIRQAQMDRRNAEQQAFERQRQAMMDRRTLENSQYERSRQSEADNMARTKFAWEASDRNRPKIWELNGALVRGNPDGSNLQEIYKSQDIADTIFGRGSNALAPQPNTPPPQQKPNTFSNQPMVRPQSFTPDRTNNPIMGTTVQYVNDTLPPQQSMQPPAQSTPQQQERMVTLPNGKQISESDLRALTFSKRPEIREGAKAYLESIKTPDGAFGKDATNKLEGKLIDSVDQLARLNQIDRTFKPEYLQYKTQLEQAGLWLQGKLGVPLTEDQKQARKEYVNWQTNTLNNVNLSIKALTGAAMSEAEAQRIIKSLPSEGDDPEAFKSKMDAALKEQRLAIYRYNYLLQRNRARDDVAFSELTLDKMEKIMDNRATQIFQKTKAENPSVPAEQLNLFVKKQLNAEFGGADI